MKKNVLLFAFLISVSYIAWSIATPLWHGPDEPAHFVHIAVIGHAGLLPQNQSYNLPINIDKSISISNFFTYNYGDRKRFMYDGSLAPFEKGVDAPIDADEASELYLSLPALDLERISLQLPSSAVETTEESVSVSLSSLKSMQVKGEKAPFVIYGKKFKQDLPLEKQPIFKTSGILFGGENVLKVLKTADGADDVNVGEERISFMKEVGDAVSLRVIPTGLSNWRYRPLTAAYPPLYYAVAAVVMKAAVISGAGIITQLFLCRLLSVLFGIIALYFVYKSFTLIWPDEKYCALAGMTLYALWPMNSFMYGVMNPDALLNLLSAAAFYFIIRILYSKEHNINDWILFSVAAALAALAKPSGILLVTIWWVLLVPLTLLKKRRLTPALLIPPAAMLLGPYLMWFRGRGFGELHGSGISLSILEYIMVRLDLRSFPIFKSFLGNFGILFNQMPIAVYWILGGIIALSAAALLYGIIRGGMSGEKLNIIYLAACTFFSWIFFYVLEYMNLGKAGIVLQGRYFLFLALPMTVLFWSAAADQREARVRRAGIVAAYLFTASSALINGLALINYVKQNFYF